MDPLKDRPVPRRWVTLRNSLRRAGVKFMRLDMHFFLSIPLFVIISAVILFQVTLYIVTKVIVKIVEETATSRTLRRHRRDMMNATSFAQYSQSAAALDCHTRRNKWKEKQQNEIYDWKTVKKITDRLHSARSNKDLSLLRETLTACLTSKFGSIMNEELYSRTYHGTKTIIEDYLTEVEASCAALAAGYKQSSGAGREAIRRAIYQINAQWGSTALVLSGGAMLGLHHTGVLECLIQEDLVPRVVSGTSAGACVAAWMCTRTDDELRAEMNVDYFFHNFKVFKPYATTSRAANFIRRGYISEVSAWQEQALRIYGDITFGEAFEKTGRVLNVSLTSAEGDQRSIVLNYKNAPKVVIYTAVLASSAFPFLIPALGLKEKTASGEIVDAESLHGTYFHDGSLKEDIPKEALREMFGCTYTVVSQVNIHVFPFCGLRAHGEAGQPIIWRGGAGRWRAGFVLSALEVFLKENLQYLFRLIAVLDVSPRFQGISLGNISVQTYIGDITLHPRFNWRHLIFLAANLSRSNVQWLLQEGRRMTYPKISFVRSRMRIEKAIQKLVSEALPSNEVIRGIKA